MDSDEKYRSDVLSADPPKKESFALRLMLEQVSELRTALEGDRPWQALVEAFPQLVDARDSLVEIGAGPDIEERLVSMYRAYVAEWQAVPGPLVDRYLGSTVTS